MANKLSLRQQRVIERDPQRLAKQQAEWLKLQERLVWASFIIVTISLFAFGFAIARFVEVNSCLNGSVEHFTAAHCSKVLN